MGNFLDRIDLAFAKLGMREPFIAAVVCKLPRKVVTSHPTAATNGSEILFNEQWCSQWNDEQLFGLSLHESLHVILMHPWMRGDRDPELWNEANDAVINAYIKARDYTLPDGGVFYPWVTEDMDSAEVYERLKKQKGGGKGGAGKKGGFGNSGDLEDCPNDAVKADIEASIITAAKMAKECGHGSALIDRILGNTGRSRTRWQDELRAMMTESAAADYSMRRPNRRFISQKLYLPSLHSEALGGLAIGFDTSCSMGDEECAQVSAEITAIAEDLQPAFVEVAYCDSKVTRVERFELGEELKLRPKGGGGTAFQPVFEHFAKSSERYCGLIYFTDMEGNLRECVEPEYPVIWADIGSSHPKAPFGTRVEVQL